MYTSGPKKVAIFPPGFNPAAGGPGGLGGAPKHMNAGANGHAPYAAPNPGANPLPGGAKAPLKGPPSMLPFEPKQPMAPPPKGPSPMHPKGPSTAPGYPPMHAPGATAAPGYALPKLPPPKQPSPPPFAAPPRQPPAPVVPDDDDPPPPPHWIDEADSGVQQRPSGPIPTFNAPPTSTPPKFGPPKKPMGPLPPPGAQPPMTRPVSGDFSGAMRPNMPPPAQPNGRPMSMHFGSSPLHIPSAMSSTSLSSPPPSFAPPKTPTAAPTEPKFNPSPFAQQPKAPPKFAPPKVGALAPGQAGPGNNAPPRVPSPEPPKTSPFSVPVAAPPNAQLPPQTILPKVPTPQQPPKQPFAPVAFTPAAGAPPKFAPKFGAPLPGLKGPSPSPPPTIVAPPVAAPPHTTAPAPTPDAGVPKMMPKFGGMPALPSLPSLPKMPPPGTLPSSPSRPGLGVPSGHGTLRASPRSARKLHELLPAGIPDSAPTMPVAAPTEPFPLRFLVGKASETRMITCSPGSAVIELLTEAMFELLEFADSDDFITYHLLCGDEKETIDNSATVSESKYVQECLARGVAPSVLLKPSNTLTDLDDLVYDESDFIVDEGAQQDPEAAAMEAELGFKLPEYAYNAHNQTQAVAAPVSIESNSQYSEPSSTATETSFSDNLQQSQSTMEQNGQSEFAFDDSTDEPPPPAPEDDEYSTPTPAEQQYEDSILSQGFKAPTAAPTSAPPGIPSPSPFTPPSGAPIPQYATPTYAPPRQGGPGRSVTPTRTMPRPSVTALTSSRRSIFEHPAMTHRIPASVQRRSANPVDTTFKARFSLPGDSQKWVVIVLESDDSIADVKMLLTNHLREQHGIDLPVERYMFKLPGASFLTNEAEIMKQLPYVHNCLMRGSEPMFVVLEKTSEAARRIKKINVEIGALIGRPMSWVQGDDEITSFRQSMTRLRYFERQKQCSSQPKEKDVLAGLPLHIGTAATPTGPNSTTLVSLTLELLQVKKKVPVRADETAAQFIQTHVEKQYHKQGKTTKSWEEFILKPPGIAEYLYGPYALHTFDYIRECIAKNKAVELMLVELSDVMAARQTEPTTASPPSSLSVSNGTRLPGMLQSTSSSQLSAVSAPILTAATEESLEDESFLLDDPTIKYDHAEISLGKRSAERMACISVWNLSRRFRIRLVGIENISPISNSFVAAYTSLVSSSKVPISCDDCPLYMYVTAELYHGGELLAKPFVSSIVPASNNPRWHEWAEFDISMCNLPRAVRVCLTAWVAKKPVRAEFSDFALSWVNMQLFDYKHELRAGPQVLKMWPDDKANPIGTTVQYDGKNPSVLYIQLDTFQLPVVFPTETASFPPYPVPTSMTNQEQAHLIKLSESDPLYRMTKHDKHLMWKYREFCKSRPKALPKFLASVPKADARAVQEMHRLLHIWTPIAPIDALELLDSKYADAEVREYAVRRLEQLSREDLLDYLLQLVQVLKYEPYHQTAFADMLVRAALANITVGHHFFWYLKSEIHVPEISERFGLLLEAYLRGCGPQRARLAAQNDLQLKFVSIANMIKPLKDSERLAALRAEMQQVAMPRAGIGLPLNPRIEVNGIRIEKCKYMDSKKLPLWLVLQNADPRGADLYVIFKSGDDLRQDMLTLQMIRIMDHLWKKNELDFHLNVYGCISTGDEVGMIEVVLNAVTTATITSSAGGATAAFRDDPIDNWIREQNPTEGAYRLARENFIYSCAGYCVATYVLGIGDRHNDNVMLTRDGRLFHIDFGHFLGNYKKKFGVKRERAPFVFTPDFAYVMGGKDSPDFMKFLDLCAKGYNVLRRHANIFINLFAMMLSTGIPELKTADDIEYLRTAFSFELNEQQAAQRFHQLVYEAMSTRTTQINNAIHIWAHKD